MHRALLLSLALLPSAPQEPITPRLAKHALFSRLALASVGKTGPNLHLLIEAPRRASETHAARVEELFAPWLARLDEVFVASFIAPNTLERKPDLPELGVIVLANLPTFTNARRYEASPDHRSEQSLFVDDPGVVVGLWNERMSRVPADVVRRPVLTRVVEGLIASHHRGQGRLPRESWVVEGIAGYLAGCGEDSTPDDLAHPPADEGALERTLAWLGEPRTEGMLLPLALIVSSSEAPVREQVARSRALRCGTDLDRAAAHRLFRDQAALWVHFLERGDGGRFLGGWRRYVAKVLHDNGSPEELARTLDTPLEELDHAFRLHLEALAGIEAAPGSGSGPIVVDEGPLLHAGLVHPGEDAAAVLADALGRAALGDLDTALAFLEAGLNGLRGDERGALAAERDRLRALRAARDSYLASLATGRGRLRWTTPAGESASALVEAIEEGLLKLGNNKAGVDAIPIDELAAGDLVRSMGSKAADHGPQWLPAYLELLAGEPRWDRKLDTASPEGAALAAARDLPRLVGEGRLRATLARLARRPLPAHPAEVRAMLAQIRALADQGTASPALAAAREGLRALAAAVLGVQWDTQDLGSRLRGRITNEGRGRVRLVYEFDDPAELEDFLPLQGYLPDRSARLPRLGEVADAGWTVRGGNLEGIGAVALRHLVNLEAPILVTYELLYGRTPPGAEPSSTLLLGICDDGKGGYVGAWDLHDLDAIEPSTGFVRSAYEQGERLILPARTHDLELEHGGRKAILKVGGQKRREIVTGRRTSGTTLLWLHSNAVVSVRRLEIRGTLARGGDDPARRAWLEGELGKLGL